MKKFVSLLVTLIMSIECVGFVYGAENQYNPVIQSLYDEEEIFYTIEDENGLYNICDENGKILSDKKYYSVFFNDCYFIVRSNDSMPYKYGVLDLELNEVIEEKYYLITEDADRNIKCMLDGKNYIYNTQFEFLEEQNSDAFFVTPIEGMEGRYVYNETPENVMLSPDCIIIDDNGKALTSHYHSVSTKVQPGNTLIVSQVMGHTDLIFGVLNSDLHLIAGMNFGNWTVNEENGVVYIKQDWAGDINYFDLLGNKYTTKEEVVKNNTDVDAASNWAEETIKKAIDAEIVPQNLRSKYQMKITRQEFCELAIETYIKKTGNTIDENIESVFTDTDNVYVANAFNLGIVSGVGDNRFAPENYITRQEAAVMLNNMANVIELNKNSDVEKFIDESYFAQWAKDSIYSICAYKDKDGVAIMTGTEKNKFSPWMNYTREQAIATMWRMFNVN